MKKLLLIAILSFGVSTASFAQQKTKKEVTISAKKVVVTRGENPNIKKDFVCNAPDVAAPKPPKTRGDICTINFINNTGYYVKAYVDGDFYGWLSPWDKGTVSVYAGYTKIYCITGGGTYDWFADGNCDTEYNYTLSVN